MGILINIIIALVVTAVVLLIVDRLNLGLSVDGFGSAVIAALVIAIVGGVVLWLLGLLGISVGGGLLGAIVYLVVAAVILLISDRFLPGLSVSGFVGAIIASIAIAVVTWIIAWLLGLLGISI
jgi:putative membrane protein